jgi:hypothetical protein
MPEFEGTGPPRRPSSPAVLACRPRRPSSPAKARCRRAAPNLSDEFGYQPEGGVSSSQSGIEGSGRAPRDPRAVRDPGRTPRDPRAVRDPGRASAARHPRRAASAPSAFICMRTRTPLRSRQERNVVAQREAPQRLRPRSIARVMRPGAHHPRPSAGHSASEAGLERSGPHRKGRFNPETSRNRDSCATWLRFCRCGAGNRCNRGIMRRTHRCQPARPRLARLIG